MNFSAMESAMSRPSPDNGYAPTRWTIIANAASANAQMSEQAIAALYEGYQPALIRLAQRCGKSKEDAEDLVQSFSVEKLARPEWWSKIDARRVSRFHRFLQVCFKNHLRDANDKEQRLIRGGGQTVISLEALAERQRAVAELSAGETGEYLRAEPMDQSRSPQEMFERDAAVLHIQRALATLRQRNAEKGKEKLFQVLLPCLQGELDYQQAGAVLGLSDAALSKAVTRFRERFREVLRDEIAQGLLDPRQIEEALADFRRALAHSG